MELNESSDKLISMGELWAITPAANVEGTFGIEVEILTHTVILCCSGLRSAPYWITNTFLLFFLSF